MAVDDAARWDARYLNERRNSFEAPRPYLLAHADDLPTQGVALDLAMGLGGNAAYLLERGLRVVGVDISLVALRQAKARSSELLAICADLAHFWLPAEHFDLIINFYYLERSLWPKIHAALRPGGLLVYETLTQAMLSVHPEIDPAYLLQPGELRQAFSNLDILDYREGWVRQSDSHDRAVAGLVGRRHT